MTSFASHKGSKPSVRREELTINMTPSRLAASAKQASPFGWLNFASPDGAMKTGRVTCLPAILEAVDTCSTLTKTRGLNKILLNADRLR